MDLGATGRPTRRALAGQPTALNVGGYFGHVSLRTYRHGRRRPGSGRPRPDEIERMASCLDEALRHGALGLSLNHFDKDRPLRLVPGYLRRRRGVRGAVRRAGPPSAAHDRRSSPGSTTLITDMSDAERFARLCRRSGVRAQWPGIPTDVLDDDQRAARPWELHRRVQAEGADFWPNIVFKPLEPFFGFERSIVFQRDPGLERAGQRPRRTEAADCWPTRPGGTAPATSGTTAPTGHGPRRPPALADLRPVRDRRRTDRHLPGRATPSTHGPARLRRARRVALAQRHRLVRCVGTPGRARRGRRRRAALREPRTLTNINDSGAHLQLFCGAGQNIYLLHATTYATLVSCRSKKRSTC